MNKILQKLQDYTTDAILYQSQVFFSTAQDPKSKEEAIVNTVALLANIDSDFVKDEYIKQLAKASKLPAKAFKTQLKKIIESKIAKATKGESKNGLDLPQNVDADEFLQDGFYPLIDGHRTGYYFRRDSEGNTVNVSNFVLTPLFHKFDQDDNTRIIKIDNGIGAPEIAEMPSKALISVDQFRNFLFDKGAFFFDGNKQHLDKLNRKYLFQFPKAFELKTLGWQPEGFFAFFNYSFNGVLKEYNEVGIVQHDDKHYFSPASSEIYKDYRKEDDMYENDRFLNYVKADIDFSRWCQLMNSVYEEHSFAAIGYVLVSLFRDLVFAVDNNCPHLYSYGQSQSGKSKYAESISNLFFNEMPGFNLNSGTDFAFAARLSRFRNCPVFFNEFDDSVVKDEWFQALKGAYDGEGRERGKGGSKKKTEIQKVNCSIMLVGQYLSTKDDNSILSRSIMEVFHKKKDRSQDAIDSYNYLKMAEKQGLSSILTELLDHRKDLDKNYYNLFNQSMKVLAADIRQQDKAFNERVLRNYAALVTMYNYFSAKLKLPFTIAAYKKWAVGRIVELSSMITNNDILTEFWTSIETMFSEGILRHGEHFKIEYKVSCRLTEDKKDTTFHLGSEKAVLYLRLKNVQQLYQKFQKQMGGQVIDLTSLSSYLHDREYYLGYINTESFQKHSRNHKGEAIVTSIKTSAFVFDYEAIGISIERGEVKLNEDITPDVDGVPGEGKEDNLPF